MSAHLILGGARSGKSRLALSLAQQSSLEPLFLATASLSASDAEMTARIQRHQASRPPHWPVIEVPIYLAKTLTQHAHPNRLILVDCLTLWLTNLLLDQESETLFQQERQALLATIPKLHGPVIFVSNETGLGIIPIGAITRRFVDESGLLHQDLAQLCNQVTLMVAGLPLTLKGHLS